MHHHFILLDTAILHTSSSSYSHIPQNTRITLHSVNSAEANLLRKATTQ